MALTPVKVLLFLLGGTAAAGLTAYVAGVFDGPAAKPGQVAVAPAEPAKDAKLAAVPPAGEPDAAADGATPAAPSAATQPAATPPADAGAQTAPTDAGNTATDQPAATSTAPGETAPAQPGTAVAPPGVEAPTFDLVRVEPDGSIVIAGKAAPNAKVEVSAGSRVLGSATAGPEGDFAIVLDDPLAPGAYQLVLRTTGSDGVVAMSQETAVVSVPDNPQGQVLALVEKPGAPSELITVPAPPPASEAPAAGEQPTGQEATQPPADAAPPPATQPAAGQETTPAKPAEPVIKVAVEAVEIEGRRIFVAGVADAGLRLRVYANDILLGETRSTEGGRFLVDTERDLPVGDYIIRVDAIGADGVKVVARAAVPFEREPGENIAAVAPQPSAEPTAPAAPAAEPDSAATTPPAVSDGSGSAASSSAASEPDSATPPATEESAAAATTADPAASGASTGGDGVAARQVEAPAVAEAPAASSTGDAEPPASASEAPATVEPQATPPATAQAETEAGPSSPSAPAAPTVAQPQAPASDGSQVAAAPDQSTAPDEPTAPTTLAPKLQSANGAVIIRRGDTLWRISRRVYGFGTRYSTIYLANQEQIQDPDRIWPGQVFNVPETSRQGEAADMTVLGDQAVRVVPYSQQ